jgi:hypothetical protein
VSTSTYCPSATDDIARLAEAARAAESAYNRERSRLAGLDTLSQQQAAVTAALAAKEAAEATLAAAQLQEERKNAERAHQHRLAAMDAVLASKTAEIIEFARLSKEYSEKERSARAEHMRLQAERAAIAG